MCTASRDPRKITTIDAHTAGEPLRVITGGWPPPEGATMLQKRRFAGEHQDHLRRALMWEPRGHADMYGCLLTAPATPDGDVGVLFMHNAGFSTMCGHGIIGVVKVGLDCGLWPSIGRDGGRATVRIDTPAGRVTATAELRDGSVERVSFRNVPSFVLHRDLAVAVPGLGDVRCDVVFGGAFYAVADAGPLGLEVEPGAVQRLIDAGMRLKRAVAEACVVAHPGGERDLDFLYGTILVQRMCGGVHSRNACVFADGELDRSPTGTGVSGRVALHWARGELAVGGSIRIESVIGTSFEVRVLESTEVGGLPAVVPEVSGRAFVTGRHEFLIDPADPLGGGFLLPRA